MVLFFLALVVSTSCISIPVFKTFLSKENTLDLLFLVLTNGIFLISTTFFYFYFKELLLSLISAFFLSGYAFLLVIQLKKENATYHFLEFPYLLFTNILFFYFVYLFLFV